MPITSAFTDSGEIYCVEVECMIHVRSLPQLVITGLPTQSVRESRERILSALRATKIKLPRSRVVIQLSPSNLKKMGTSLDLAMVLAFLQAQGHAIPHHLAAVGEVDITGRVVSSGNMLALVESLSQTKKVLVPADAPELIYCSRPEQLIPLNRIGELLNARVFSKKFVFSKPQKNHTNQSSELLTLSEQHLTVLALIAAGGHHTLLFGSPGQGKSASLHWLWFLLPHLSHAEQSELAQFRARWGKEIIGSVANTVMPHHSLSMAQMKGQATTEYWGPLWESHGGILFLDEMSEFRKDVLESLRQPMEGLPSSYAIGKKVIAVPCRTTVVGTTNPCRCGFYGNDQCRCTQEELRRYYQKFSGALLDRMALFYRVEHEFEPDTRPPEWWRNTVQAAYNRQVERALAGYPPRTYLYTLENVEKLWILPELWKSRIESWSMRRQMHFRQVTQTLRDLFPEAQMENLLSQAYLLVKPSFVPNFD